MSPTVHVLHYGRVLCGSVHGEPRGWGAGHVWTWMHDVERVTCAECKRCTKLWQEKFEQQWRERQVMLPPAGPAEEEAE